MPFKHASSPFYHYDRQFTLNGNHYRFRGSTGETSKTRAREVEDHIIRTEKHRLMYGAEKQQLTLDQAMGTYIANVSAFQSSYTTTVSLAKSLMAGIKKKTPLIQVTAPVLTGYITKRRATVSNATVNRELQLLKRVMNYAAKNLDAVSPSIEWKALMSKEAEKRIRELTSAEEGALFTHLREDFHPLVRFCLLTGARFGSAISLEWQDVDFDGMGIRFRTMKGGKSHTIPMSPELLILIANQPRTADQVFTFIGRKGARRRSFTASSTRKPFVAALKAAKVNDFRFHDLRHTALSRITRVAGIAVACELAGHSDISTTARYAHVQNEDVLNAMRNVENSINPQYAHKAGKKV